jgi:hypothetical protein
MLERWNDDKMDALEVKVDSLGAQMRELRHEMKAGFERIDARFERVDDRFERTHRLMVQAVIGLLAAYIAGFAALIGLIATQL